jgi:hypothetical protein
LFGDLVHPNARGAQPLHLIHLVVVAASAEVLALTLGACEAGIGAIEASSEASLQKELPSSQHKPAMF